MGRSIIAVIVAYISMFILNFLAFVGLYALVGPARRSNRPHILHRSMDRDVVRCDLYHRYYRWLDLRGIVVVVGRRWSW